jgi:hypothetical protein
MSDATTWADEPAVSAAPNDAASLTRDSVFALRKRLWASGFRPVGVITGDKMPRVAAWQERARRDPPANAADPPRSDHLNTGILVDGLRVIDVDIDDDALAGAVRQLVVQRLGGAPPIRTRPGTGRCALLYRAATGEPRKQVLAGTAGKVEVLGFGQQLHAFGRHPSGSMVTWHPAPPGEITRDELPAVTEDDIAAMLNAIAPLIGATTRPEARHPPSSPGGRAARAHASVEEVRAAVDAIANEGPADWDLFNRVGMAIWSALGGAEVGLSIFSDWARRNPAYEQAETDGRWSHYSVSPPTVTGIRALRRLGGADDVWAPPDMSVPRLNRRPPPAFPTDVFGPAWKAWGLAAAEAASAPPDYVFLPLIAAASVLIGHARWAQAAPGVWSEPPHLWAGVIGDSGSSKSPGADCLLRDVLPILERDMAAGFPDRLREWRAAAEAAKADTERWCKDVATARKLGRAPPLPPADSTGAEPQAPRLRQVDVTIERVATLLATAAPKGLLIVRDELAGWLQGMNTYNDAGRAFWLEAYGGRPFRVERQKHPEPIVIQRLAVGVTGGVQPEKLAQLFRDHADDGLLARFIWAWPDPVPFRIGRIAPDAPWAAHALNRLRALELAVGDDGRERPVMVTLTPKAQTMMEAFGQDMQARQAEAGGLMRSAYGKARGLALRLGLVLAMLRWCARDGEAPPPSEIDDAGLALACDMVSDYFMPSAERVYGDAAAPITDRTAATLARWILNARPSQIHLRALQREVRLPELNTAESIRSAAEALVEADWLRAVPSNAPGRPKGVFAVNPALLAS